MRNFFHTLLLIGAMAVIAASISWLVWGETAVLWAAGMVVLGLAFYRTIPSALILVLLRAQPLSPMQWREGHAIIATLSRRARLAVPPRLYYLPSSLLNAFSLGKGEDAAIVITQGLLARLDEREMVGVLAHEISHFRNHDTGLLSLAFILTNLTFVMALFGLALVVISFPYYLISGQTPPLLLILLLGLAPHVVALLLLALSRAREFDADRGAAALTGDPLGLASALEKLELPRAGYWELVFPDRAHASPWLRSHPGSRERIARLLGAVRQ